MFREQHRRIKAGPQNTPSLGLLVFLPCAMLLFAIPARAQGRPLDVLHSRIAVHVFKAGLFSAFGHDHLIGAPISGGDAGSSEKPSVRLQIDASRLQVEDPQASPETRAEIEKTMKGPTVLDAGRFPEIVFESVSVEERGDARWTVRGNLTLHGATRPVEFGVTLDRGRYRGSATLRQRDFGIQPVAVAGGTIRVKDEVRIDFDVTLAASQTVAGPPLAGGAVRTVARPAKAVQTSAGPVKAVQTSAGPVRAVQTY